MDMNEFARRFTAAKDKLYRIALLYLGNADTAEEVLDEAAYRGVKACGRLKEPEYFDTWMTRILINAASDELRRRKRHQSFEELPESAAEEFDSLPLKDAISRLPKELKEIVVLRYFSGYTLKETAEILDIPQGTAATRQRRALSLLRLELGEEVQR